MFAGLLGLNIGSFLNVVAHRVPAGESVVSPPSACPKCGHLIRNRHNVPVLGWMVLRGRCFDCGEPISARYPLVEAGTGLVFALVAVRFGADAEGLRLLPAYLTFAAVAIALALIDLDVHRLPDVIVLPSYPVLAVLLAIGGDGPALLRAAEGAAVLGVFFFVVWYVAPGGMGFGDVKLAGLVGAMTAYLTWGTFLVGAFLGFVLGAVAGLLLMAGGRAGRRTALPFGPFMVLGAWSAILGAGYLGDLYLDSLGR
ncbi:prepilin peptidase [Nocardioides daeguensis]|uniref:A24 family peptidase n=1 Tax=Nocardioides daeguensis TaxID=908359 RepID=A0ABP6UV15_9ACTN|nr:A24 family peptidase [Nocardioides daeguensis]MBV6725965.1 prepilin peptidase [Nocardioides daeguensis]MCR1772519.1 prepilin peptidase [Nocardioides daeguensis]